MLKLYIEIGRIWLAKKIFQTGVWLAKLVYDEKKKE